MSLHLQRFSIRSILAIFFWVALWLTAMARLHHVLNYEKPLTKDGRIDDGTFLIIASLYLAVVGGPFLVAGMYRGRTLAGLGQGIVAAFLLYCLMILWNW